MRTEEPLNKKERIAMRLSADLWNAILDMERDDPIHNDDIHEYRRDIHDIQNRIMARAYISIHRMKNQNPSE